MSDRITLRFLAAPADAAVGGHRVQAGRVLEWIDKAGYACAVGFSGGYCVTAYVGNVHFTKPIRPGALVEARARILHAGRTSMHVQVAVSTADPRDGVYTLATHCLLVFVAVGDDGAPRQLPPFEPDGAAGRELAEAVVGRIPARRRILERMLERQYTDAGTTPRVVFRFLAAPGDVNWGGKVHGGIAMRWIDETAHACAMRWSAGDTVAVYSGGIHFFRPLSIGDIVEITARLIHTTEHSMHIAVHVRSGDPRSDELHLATQCMTVFVAVGDDGRTRAIDQLELRSDEDVRLRDHAVELIALRAAMPPVGVAV